MSLPTDVNSPMGTTEDRQLQNQQTALRELTPEIVQDLRTLKR